MATKIYGATSLGSGTGGLKAIDGANLADLDIAIVCTLTDFYIYSLDDDSAAAESSPDVISPDANAGSKRWILVKKYANDTVVLLTGTQTLTNKTLTSPVINTSISGTAFLDEDDMASDSATKVASQQSIKALVDIRAPEYGTILIPASALVPTDTNGAEVGTNEYATNDVEYDYLAFDGATEEFACVNIPFPENWDRSTVKAKFCWSSATGSTAADTVEWELALGAISNDDAIDAAYGTAQVISDALLANNGTDSQLSGATPAITVGGSPALHDTIQAKVSRNVGGTDDMTEDAWLFWILIQYKKTNTVAAW
jgi:hypothetical protein